MPANVNLCLTAWKEGKVVPVHDIKAYGKRRCSSAFATWAVDGVEWSASRPAALPLGDERQYPLSRRLVGPQSRCSRFWEEKNPLPIPENEPWPRYDKPAFLKNDPAEIRAQLPSTDEVRCSVGVHHVEFTLNLFRVPLYFPSFFMKPEYISSMLFSRNISWYPRSS